MTSEPGRARRAPALTRFALARPRAALAAWLAAVAVLAAVGLGIDGHLSGSGLSVSGSESGRARALLGQTFEDSATVPVLLRGPRADVKAQGKALVRRLSGRPGVAVLSPWASSAGATPLRPSADRALLLLSVTGTSAETTRRTQAVQRIVARATSAPVRATVTGTPLLSSEGTRESLAAVHRAEAIALPLLLLALLLVFRSPLAAAIPALFGAATIAGATGALALLAHHVRLDAFALAVASMVGLALAVDYSLLMVSRLREERAADPGGDVRDAVARAALPTVRTVAVAGAAIVAAMAVAAALSPGTAVLSAALGVSVVAVLAAAGAALAVPAMLVLAGGRLTRGAVAARRAQAGGASAWLARAATRRPLLGAVAALALAALSVPALDLHTGVPGAGSLPPGSDARAGYDTVSAAMGAGWAEPFELVAVARRGTVTTAERLAQLERLQRRIGRDPAVRAVLGPGTMAASAARLRRAGRRAAASRSAVGQRAGGRLRRLDRGVTSAAGGVDALRGALTGATAAATRIDAGSRDLEGGLGALRTGLTGAGAGAQRLADRLGAAGRGAQALAARAAAARRGARELRRGVKSLGTGLTTVAGSARDLQGRLRRRGEALARAQAAVRAERAQADGALAAAERALPAIGLGAIRARAALRQARQALAADAGAALDEPARQIAADADYAAAIAAATPAHEARRLAASVGRLSDGTAAMASRLDGLGGAVRALAGGTGSLVDALGRLDGGAGRLGAAFGVVREGVDGLAGGVRDGERRTAALAGGLQDARTAMRGLGTAGPADGPASGRATTGFFDSGYFLLAALESGQGATPFGVNVERGGQGARIVVVPRHPVSDPRTQALYARLRATAAGLDTSMGADAAVGGPAALLSDYDEAAGRRLPQIVLLLALVTALLLGVLLRSVVVPLIGVVLNLLAVGATLGLLALLFQGASPPLGGPGEIDAIAVTAIFGVVFALSIDYQVFIVSRVREEWLRGASEAEAVRLGLARTARVVTGAALSMLGVFVAFALADIASLRQFGVGLAIAVVIDATVVRLVLLPAALRLAGRWAWWSPRLGVAAEPGAAPARAALETP